MANPNPQPAFTTYSTEIAYIPPNHLSTLGRFNIAQCARARMTEYVSNESRWKRERIGFYTSLQMMRVDEFTVM